MTNSDNRVTTKGDNIEMTIGYHVTSCHVMSCQGVSTERGTRRLQAVWHIMSGRSEGNRNYKASGGLITSSHGDPNVTGTEDCLKENIK